MVKKKSKGGGGKGGKGSSNSRPAQKPQQNELLKEPHLTLKERVDSARPLWESSPHQDRVALLTVDIGALRQRAQLLTEEQQQQQQEPQSSVLEDSDHANALGDILEGGLRRIKQKGTWKLWSWPEGGTFCDAESFRSFILEKHIPEDLRRCLPREDPKAPEKPAETAFRQRMVALIHKVNNMQSPEDKIPSAVRAHRRKHGAAADGTVPAVHDGNVELVKIILEALEQEHECLYQSVLQPIIAYVMQVLPEGGRETEKAQLALEDLEKLSSEQAMLLAEWLTEKVDALSMQLRAEPKEEGGPEQDEEEMGDVDLWSLVDDGKALTVNEKWLQHLQERLMDEKGQPRKARAGEDPRSNGLVLEWVYGFIVSTAEKARDGAQRHLGLYTPTASEAHAMLLRALEDFHLWESRGRQAKELMSDMLKSRLEVQELTKACEGPAAAPSALLAPAAGADAGGGGGGGGPSSSAADELGSSPMLPDHVVVAMLRREALLSKAKLHRLVFDQLQQEELVRSLKAQLRKGEPEFERLKRELDETKPRLRTLDGANRSTSETERRRAQMADAALEEQLKVETAFREQGARLQAIYDKKHRVQSELDKREAEVKQLQGWRGTVENLAETYQEVLLAVGLGLSGGGGADAVALGLGEVGSGEAAVLATVESRPSGAAVAAVGERAPGEGTVPGVARAMQEVEAGPGQVPETAIQQGCEQHLERKCAAEQVAGTGAMAALGGSAVDAAATAGVDAGAQGVAAAAAGTSWGEAGAAEPPAAEGANPARAPARKRARRGTDDDAEAGNEGLEPTPTTPHCMHLAKLRTHFHKELRKQLYSDTEDKQIFDWLKQEVKVVEKRLDESRVALQHLEMHLINIACDDPGVTINMQLALPILQERLDAAALEHAAARAKAAEAEVLRMEMEQQAREAAEQDRRLKAKQSKKDKVRSEREKMAAEKAAEEERRAEEAAKLRLQDVEERKQRLAQVELARREEEEQREQRRRELLSEEHGYWRSRMDAEAQPAGAGAAEALDGAGSRDAPCTPQQQEKAEAVADALPTSSSPGAESTARRMDGRAGSTSQCRPGGEEPAAAASPPPPPPGAGSVRMDVEPPGAEPRGGAEARSGAGAGAGQVPAAGASRCQQQAAAAAPGAAAHALDVALGALDLADTRSCAWCGATKGPGVKLKTCSRCQAARYCSETCQTAHWRQGGHKEQCTPKASQPNGSQPC